MCFRGAKIENMTGSTVTDPPSSNTSGDLVTGVSGWGNATWDPDLVIIQIGINDVKQLQTGAGNGTWTSNDETEFFDDLNELIDEVATRHPSADIFVCNLTRVIGCATNTLTCQEATDVNAGVNAVNAAMLTSTLSSNADLVIDIQSVVDPLTETMPNDGLHPNSDGLDDIGWEIASEMKDYYLW